VSGKAFIRIKCDLGDGLQEYVFRGRRAWALRELHTAGSKGVSRADNYAPALTQYVAQLKSKRFDIRTIREKHSGPYSGFHARYVLMTDIGIIDWKEPQPE